MPTSMAPLEHSTHIDTRFVGHRKQIAVTTSQMMMKRGSHRDASFWKEDYWRLAKIAGGKDQKYTT